MPDEPKTPAKAEPKPDNEKRKPVWGGKCVICGFQVIDGHCAHCGHTAD